MADAHASGACEETREGSSPFLRIKFLVETLIFQRLFLFPLLY